MSISKRFTTATLVAVLGTCLASSAAGSQTTQVTQATALGACTPNSTTAFTPGYSNSLLYNESTTQTMFADCSLPIATASVSELAEGSIFLLHGINKSSSENLTCNFKVVSPQGFVVTTLASQSLAPGVSNNLVFNYGGLHLMAPGYASCQIPKQQGVFLTGSSGLTSVQFIYNVWPD